MKKNTQLKIRSNLNVNAGRRLGGCAETLIHHRLYRPMQINVISYQ